MTTLQRRLIRALAIVNIVLAVPIMVAFLATGQFGLCVLLMFNIGFGIGALAALRKDEKEREQLGEDGTPGGDQ